MGVGAVAGQPLLKELNPLPPWGSTSPVRPGLHGLAGMVGTAKALAVCCIERCTAVAQFFDVISKQPMLR